ncbi:uncharacterized protein BXIN_0636 [Babesia sp. Xinjiang]|uniref:uncharacterized protein n=1 Tax=Babesia sp. Xinjiang TaxID=462227 RepID=UPI000A23DFEE|nr:uncharacterized protein BXIN_0636 [Babesia sp. Xinjiang]ORM41830.1 hypothetical protein BXIN_0636 [Babesia sp. Xinjiang]
MRQRVSKVAGPLVRRCADLGYGNFTGTEFCLTAGNSNEQATNCLTNPYNGNSIGGKDLGDRANTLGRKSRVKLTQNGVTHLTAMRGSAYRVSVEPNVNPFRGGTAISSAIALAPLFRGKVLPYKAKAYLGRWILAEHATINADNFNPLVGAIVALGLANRDLIQLCITKLEEMRLTASYDKRQLHDAALLILNVPEIQVLVHPTEVGRCLSVLRSSADATVDANLRVAALYIKMLPTGLVQKEELGSVISIIVSTHRTVRKQMTLVDCASANVLINAAWAYINAIGDGWYNDVHGKQIREYMERIVIPETELHVNVFTATQITELISFMAYAGLNTHTHVLEVCSERFVRDVAQFSVSNILAFHTALMRLGYRHDRAIMTLIVTLTRREQSIDSVDHVICLLEIMYGVGINSECMYQFVSEQLMQLGHKVGRRHCEKLAQLFARSGNKLYSLLNPSALQVLDRLRAKYVIKLR